MKKATIAAKQYQHAYPVQADLRQPSEVEAMFATINKEVGVINGLVNNAGIGLSKPVHQIEPAEYDQVFGVNVRGTWLTAKYFVKQLLDNDLTGNIVNISSVHGLASQPNYSTYASTKAAIEGMTRALAYELGQYNIRCNAVGPGMVHAEQNLALIKNWAPDPEQWVNDFIQHQQVLHHFIEPIDCGYTIAFLLSEWSRSITGQTIYVDAGKTIMLFNQDYINPSGKG